MSQYKDTLNLPKTDFPMKGNLSQREPQMLAAWQEMGLYDEIRKCREGAQKFILNDGPPYANGDLHMGHAVNKTLKDIIVKSKTLSGYDAPFIPGWDCHGLPIELNVEKKLGKAGMKISHQAFREACREYAQKQVNNQSMSFQRMGVLGDWDHPYLTMDFTFEANIIRALAKIIDNGHLHRGYKPVHWCTDCGSALAEAEVEYEDKMSPAIDVQFNVIDRKCFWQACGLTAEDYPQGDVSVVIWTTTPWTLPANQAVALNAALEYVVIKCDKGGRQLLLCVASALLENALSRWEIDSHKIVASCQGKALEGLKLQHPFYQRDVPIVLGDHVTIDAGTGCVHTAPAHGMDDYHLAEHYGLPVDHEVLDNGCFSENTEFFAGLHVSKAHEKVIETLDEKGTLLHQTRLRHSYPHCWRHKTPLIFRATPQWFISMEQQGLRQLALETVDKVEWIPDWGKARMADMIGKRPDWCISRQRTWGTPIPVLIHKKTDELHPNMQQFFEKIAQRIEQQGIDAWQDIDIIDLLGDDTDDYRKIYDTLDVWFDSGVVHYCVVEQRPELCLPSDLCLEGSDQHRGWFQTSLLSSLALRGETPYKAVLTHGFTVDDKGRKMSKSLGNTMAPDKVMKTMGADIIRLWVAATDYRGEMAVSDEIFKRTVDTYRRLRNTARFLLANLSGFDPQKDLLPSEKLLSLDRWAIDRAYHLQQTLLASYDSYQFHNVVQHIQHFCAIEMGSFYLDVIKDRQYTTQENSIARRSAQTAMYHIVKALAGWLAPILSFTAEEISQHIPGNKDASIFLTTWYEGLYAFDEDATMGADFWQQLLLVRSEVNKYLEAQRASGMIGSSLNAEVVLHCEKPLYERLSLLGEELHFALITSSAELIEANSQPKGGVATELRGLWLTGSASSHDKCVRCWHYDSLIGESSQHPELCPRCISNVDGQGEERRYV